MNIKKCTTGTGFNVFLKRRLFSFQFSKTPTIMKPTRIYKDTFGVFYEARLWRFKIVWTIPV